jgi:hypothetical protein
MRAGGTGNWGKHPLCKKERRLRTQKVCPGTIQDFSKKAIQADSENRAHFWCGINYVCARGPARLFFWYLLLRLNYKGRVRGGSGIFRRDRRGAVAVRNPAGVFRRDRRRAVAVRKPAGVSGG